MSGPFSGLRVVDTTHVLAGPFASYQMALLGAEVIKVESPQDPDQARFQGSDRDMVKAAMGTAFLSQGAGKKAIALDLKTGAGRDALCRLLATADVFVENYRPGAFEALGLGHEALARLNPKLIYCSISAFGASGPRREQTGYDNVIQAFSGIMDLTGHGDDRPLKSGAPAVDYATGMTAAFAISAALVHRNQTGRGQHIDVSMLEVAMTLLTSHATDYMWSGKHPKAKGNQYAFATLGMYRASDADLMIAASNLRQQKRLWIALGREDLVKKTNLERLDDFTREQTVLAGMINTMPAAFWETFLNERRIPAARVRRMGEAMADPQMQAREQVKQLEDPAGHVDGLRVVTSAFRLSGAETGLSCAPQAVGAQTYEVLQGLGMTTAEIDALCAAGIAKQAAPANDAASGVAP
ncbi:CaiB/BaiF CoA transferase family protein [Phaeovulum sp. W22_SRMD_FR3]|uniref:CaiB/BaiF CoA transferase family protein n=1 Tax=Phaeovulum sp. W22_SRMD_FR3 TaxID=3240274 RepID=UPI003F99AD2A